MEDRLHGVRCALGERDRILQRPLLRLCASAAAIWRGGWNCRVEAGFLSAHAQGVCAQARLDLLDSDGSGAHASVPKGAYYVLAEASQLPGESSKEKAMYLLAKTGVACVPGESFYHDDGGENLIRFCYAKTDADLREASDRLMRL